MNIFKKTFGKLAAKGAIPYSFFADSGIMPNIVTKTDALDYYKSWVYACIARRSMGIAQIEFRLYRLKRNGEVEEILEHELLELLYRVNPEMTKYNFLQLSIIYRDLLGASPWILERGDKRKKTPDNIFIARPEFFKVKKDENNNITGYVYEIGTFKKTYAKDEVIFLKNYNPKNPDKGIGVIEAVRQTIENDDCIMQANSNLLKNNARPSGFLEVEGSIDEKMISRLKKQFREKHQGYENNYDIQILSGGLKFKPVALPPKDLDFIESRKMNRDEILSIFGVPKPILGVFEDVNRASALAAEYAFNKWTLEPLATELIEQLNEFLVPMFGKDLWLSFEPLAKEDNEFNLKKKAEAWNKWMTTNEVREVDGLSPINGGDYLYMPINQIPLAGGEKKETSFIKIKVSRECIDLKTQKLIKRRILNRNLSIDAISKKAGRKIENKIFGNKKVILKIKQNKKINLNDIQKQNFYDSRINEEEWLEELWKVKFIEFFEKQKDRFITTIKDYYKKEVKQDYGVKRSQELKATIELINPLLYETLIAGIKGASQLIGEDFMPDMPFIKKWMEKVSLEIGRNINDTTIKAFIEEMKYGIEAGENLQELARRVESVFDFASDYRAELIARTEAARGVVEAHRHVYKYYGYEKVQWLLSPDACERCISKSIEDWTIDSIKEKIPVHPNCKCDFTPI